jgi:hypothetical protein
MLPSTLLWKHSHIIILLPCGMSCHELLSRIISDLNYNKMGWMKNPTYPTSKVVIFTRLSALRFLHRRSIAVLRWGVKSSLVKRYSQRLRSQPIMVYPLFFNKSIQPHIYRARTLSVPCIVYTENVLSETERLVREGFPVSPLGVAVTDKISDIRLAPSHTSIYISHTSLASMGRVLMRCTSRRVGILADGNTVEQVLRITSAATSNYQSWKKNSCNLTLN